MSDQTERLDQLEKNIQNLIDRQAILDCVAKNARGCDRHDSDLLASAYHPDGVDEHGFSVNMGPDYPAWANEQHSNGSLQHLHHITHQTCEIDGDEAHCESYVIGLFLNKDGQSSHILSGRYLDRLEKRDGEWRIALRRSTVEVFMKADAAMITSPFFAKMGFLKGLRDKTDLSYKRPLTLEDTPDDHRW